MADSGFWVIFVKFDYPVENVGPAFHGDTLENGEHGEQKVVKVGDAVVGALPALSANGAIDQAAAAVPWDSARRGLLLCQGSCRREHKHVESTPNAKDKPKLSHCFTCTADDWSLTQREMQSAWKNSKSQPFYSCSPYIIVHLHVS